MWLKKHWNDPITVGGLTKFNIWCFVISVVSALAWLGYLFIRWSSLGDRIKEWWLNLVHKPKKVKATEEQG